MTSQQLLDKLEETIIDDDGFNTYENYARDALSDRTCIKTALGDESRSSDPNRATNNILRNRYQGGRGGHPTLGGRHSEMFYGFIDQDHRGTNNQPRFDKMRHLVTPRILNHKKSAGHNVGHTDLIEINEPWNNVNIDKTMIKLRRNMKKRINWFKSQLGCIARKTTNNTGIGGQYNARLGGILGSQITGTSNTKNVTNSDTSSWRHARIDQNLRKAHIYSNNKRNVQYRGDTSLVGMSQFNQEHTYSKESQDLRKNIIANTMQAVTKLKLMQKRNTQIKNTTQASVTNTTMNVLNNTKTDTDATTSVSVTTPGNNKVIIDTLNGRSIRKKRTMNSGDSDYNSSQLNIAIKKARNLLMDDIIKVSSYAKNDQDLKSSINTFDSKGRQKIYDQLKILKQIANSKTLDEVDGLLHQSIHGSKLLSNNRALHQMTENSSDYGFSKSGQVNSFNQAGNIIKARQKTRYDTLLKQSITVHEYSGSVLNNTMNIVAENKKSGFNNAKSSKTNLGTKREIKNEYTSQSNKHTDLGDTANKTFGSLDENSQAKTQRVINRNSSLNSNSLSDKGDDVITHNSMGEITTG